MTTPPIRFQTHATFRPSPPPSYWTWILFVFTFPSIPDAWRQFIDSQEHSPFHMPLLAVHRSLKAIYNLIVWVAYWQSREHWKKTSELGRALNDGIQLAINHQARRSYHDDEHEDDSVTNPLLRANQSDQVENDAGVLSTSVVWRVNWIIHNSKQLQTTKHAVQSTDSDPKELAGAIIALKRINPILCPNLEECLVRIRKASRIRKLIQERSNIAYSPELHRHKFKELLKLLKPNQDYDTLPAKGWQEIGFQGADPSTDLRGAGILGLDALLVFGKYFGPQGQKIVTEAIEGGQSWYPWALASINVTWWCISLAKTHKLDYFLLSSLSSSTFTPSLPSGSPENHDLDNSNNNKKKKKTNSREESSESSTPEELIEFLIFQSKLTYLFHQYWFNLKKKPNVMEFEFRFKCFKNQIILALSKGFIGGLGVGWILDSELDLTHPAFSNNQF